MIARDKKVHIIAAILLISVACSAQIPKDKKDHMLVGTAIGFGASAITINKPVMVSLYWSVGATAVIGGTKELIDLAGKGNAEWADLGATVAGGIIGWGLASTFKGLALLHSKRMGYKGLTYGSTYIGDMSYNRVFINDYEILNK